MNMPSCCIGQTKRKGKVYVTQSQWTDIPHFTFVTADEKRIDLQIERTVTLEPLENIDLKDRKDLQDFLTIHVWREIIQKWNQYHGRQVPPELHVPDYINLYSPRDTACLPIISPDPILQGSKLVIGVDDICAYPHFHYVRPDHSECLISLLDDKFMSQNELSVQEKNALQEYLQMSCRNRWADTTNYQFLLHLWNLNNQNNAVNEDLPMPNYTMTK